jgi:hypothetical protein
VHGQYRHGTDHSHRERQRNRAIDPAPAVAHVSDTRSTPGLSDHHDDVEKSSAE